MPYFDNLCLIIVFELNSLLPIIRFAFQMHDRNDFHRLFLIAINNTVWKSQYTTFPYVELNRYAVELEA